MLTQTKDIKGILDRVVTDRLRGFTVRKFARDGGEGHNLKCLIDDPADPRVVILFGGTNFMVYGDIHRLNGVMSDLLGGMVDAEDGWPDPGMENDFKEHMEGHRGIFLNTAPYAVWRAAIIAGFDPHPDDKKGQVAYQWYWEGEPRYSHLIEHSCRAVEGQELFELMKLAVHYDPDGHYIKMCLNNGPSFVCEVDGEPVCWSCTHLNGTMGMIYTPDELRRKGYARSLAAFQLDYMLKRDGLACCHVIDYNTASMNMVQSLGAICIPEPLVWRTVWWPGEAPPPQPKDEREPANEGDSQDSCDCGGSEKLE